MTVDHDTTTEKHIITQHNNMAQGRLVAFTYCGWTYLGTKMEGAYDLGDWWKNPKLAPHMCKGCVHVADCKDMDAKQCAECRKIEEEKEHPLNRAG